MPKSAIKKSPIRGPIWINVRVIHLEWRRYPLTLCGQRTVMTTREHSKASVRAKEYLQDNAPMCETCLATKELLKEEGLI